MNDYTAVILDEEATRLRDHIAWLGTSIEEAQQTVVEMTTKKAGDQARLRQIEADLAPLQTHTAPV